MGNLTWMCGFEGEEDKCEIGCKKAVKSLARHDFPPDYVCTATGN